MRMLNSTRLLFCCGERSEFPCAVLSFAYRFIRHHRCDRSNYSTFRDHRFFLSFWFIPQDFHCHGTNCGTGNDDSVPAGTIWGRPNTLTRGGLYRLGQRGERFASRTSLFRGSLRKEKATSGCNFFLIRHAEYCEKGRSFLERGKASFVDVEQTQSKGQMIIDSSLISEILVFSTSGNHSNFPLDFFPFHLLYPLQILTQAHSL